MRKLRIALTTLMLVAGLAALGGPVQVTAQAVSNTIDVSQPTHLTENNEYDRNPSIIWDGTEYWLLYTKGDDTGTAGVRGSGYNPDGDTYVVYYKRAATIVDLATAGETKLALSESARPANFDQRVVSATYFDGKVYAFVSSGQSGTTRGLHYYAHDGTSWSGPTTLIANATARGGHVNVSSDGSRVYIVWESSDGSSDCYTWDGTTLSSKIDISTDNMPKITLMGSTLYVVSIEDGSGDIKVYSSATSPVSWRRLRTKHRRVGHPTAQRWSTSGGKPSLVRTSGSSTPMEPGKQESCSASREPARCSQCGLTMGRRSSTFAIRALPTLNTGSFG